MNIMISKIIRLVQSIYRGKQYDYEEVVEVQKELDEQVLELKAEDEVKVGKTKKPKVPKEPKPDKEKPAKEQPKQRKPRAPKTSNNK